MNEAKIGKRKRNAFMAGLGWIFWLGVLGFLLYRSILGIPSEQGRLYLISTKYNGYQKKIFRPGGYYISWQNLLPGNVTLLSIPYQSKELYVKRNFVLPSAENYLLLLPQEQLQFPTELSAGQNPFQYQISLRLRYRYRAESLLDFVSNPANTLVSAAANIPGPSETSKNSAKKAGPGEGELLSRLENKLRKRLNEEISSLFSNTNKSSPAAVEQYLSNTLLKAFPELEIFSLDIESYQQPDLELYAQVKQAYGALLKELSGQSLERLLQEQGQRVAGELYLQNIERLGKILSDYPLLLQYFAVTNAETPLRTFNEQISRKILQQIEP
ncbi:MAG: hypothetical protein AAF975_01890 [Spirochaetota bacterium]